MPAAWSKAALFLAAAAWAGTGSIVSAHGGGGDMGGGSHHHEKYRGAYYRGFFGMGGLDHGNRGHAGLGYDYIVDDGLVYGGLGYGDLGYQGVGLGSRGFGSSFLYNPYGSQGHGVVGDGYPGYGYSRMDGDAFAATTITQANEPFLGINEQPLTEANGTGMKVTIVYAGSAAERAGLKVGDVIHSINGYNTQTRGNITWIIRNAAPDGTLKMNVRHAGAANDVVVVASVR
jgi:hypothetical protein